MKVMTVTGIRPDFIRMCEVFKKFDENFEHILVHTGQHYDKMLSGIFFEELNIRKPDYNLQVGGHGKHHYEIHADLTTKIVPLANKIEPDWIVFLGDSNSVLSAVDLKKEGFRIAHIEAGMRSHDKRMFEEINRTVCDHCSDLLLVYHDAYKENCVRENIDPNSVFVVGNTVVEVCKKYSESLLGQPKKRDFILLDIHRPENFNYPERFRNIVKFATMCGNRYDLPVKMLLFSRTFTKMSEFGIQMNKIKVEPLMSFKDYLAAQYHAKFLISDSGTAQEEPSLLNTPVIVPRNFTERPQSIKHSCSIMVDVNFEDSTWRSKCEWVDDVIAGNRIIDPSWLGDGKTSHTITEILKSF